jgi:hypothetical protein
MTYDDACVFGYVNAFMMNEKGVMVRKKVMLERQKKKTCGRNANHHAFMLSFRREKEEEQGSKWTWASPDE